MDREDYVKDLDSRYRMFADTYSLLLYNGGHYKEAVTYQEKAIAKLEDPDADMYARYVTYLRKDGQVDKAFAEAERIIRDGNAKDTVRSEFKALYLQLGKMGDYNSYIAKLDEAADLKEKASWFKKMIDILAPLFSN